MKTLIVFLILAAGGWYFYTNYEQAETKFELKPRDAEFSAARDCDFQEKETVTIVLNDDKPQPACTRVRPDQNLRVENNTERTIKVWFDNVSAKALFPSSIDLKLNSRYLFGAKFGEYMEPGVHRLNTSLYTDNNGPEIWLVK